MSLTACLGLKYSLFHRTNLDEGSYSADLRHSKGMVDWNIAQLSMLIMKVLGSSMWVRLGVGKQEQGIGLLYGICLMVV